MNIHLVENYHADAITSFRIYMKFAERAMKQIPNDEFFASMDAESNSMLADN